MEKSDIIENKNQLEWRVNVLKFKDYKYERPDLSKITEEFDEIFKKIQ